MTILPGRASEATAAATEHESYEALAGKPALRHSLFPPTIVGITYRHSLRVALGGCEWEVSRSG